MEVLLEQLNFQDLSATFTVADVVISLVLSFILTSIIAKLYQQTHKGTSYTQSYVHTLVLMGMIVSLIMLIVGSNIARAFSLVGALSIIRFRNAVKETRDVGFIFFAMAIGMANGTRFYLLAVMATVIIGFVILIMNRFDWYGREVSSQLLKIQVANNVEFDTLFIDTFAKFTDVADLISVDTVRSGMLTELIYNVSLKKRVQLQEFLSTIKQLNGNQKVTLITGYNNVDL
ncbi:FIG01139921: hypothetical protein [hydrothermal vent metagenome]|uniref:DUF4956 domain-containing protein n=1 Tax=hydrothermal vent metagenome TaxID=652676 RepID=A0A3B0UYK0_9ZZZZ